MKTLRQCAGAPSRGRQLQSPAVIRVAIRAVNLHCGAVYHSQRRESIFTHCPGRRVVPCPPTALTVAGPPPNRHTLRRSGSHVPEQQSISIASSKNRSEYPATIYTVPSAKGRLSQEGPLRSALHFRRPRPIGREVAARELRPRKASRRDHRLRSQSPLRDLAGHRRQRLQQRIAFIVDSKTCQLGLRAGEIGRNAHRRRNSFPN